MGERGPKSSVLQVLTPEERAELDGALVEGKASKAELFEQFGKAKGLAYRSFCRYAEALEARAKHRYVGELLTKVFGNLPDAEIDLRARGIMMAMLDRIAGDVLADGELKPRDLRDVVKSYDLIRRGAIAEADEERRRLEWQAVRAVTIAEAAAWLTKRLADEVAGDEELRQRLNRAVEKLQTEQPGGDQVSVKLIEQIANKRDLSKSVAAIAAMIYGADLADADAIAEAGKTLSPAVRDRMREIYGVKGDG